MAKIILASLLGISLCMVSGVWGNPGNPNLINGTNDKWGKFCSDKHGSEFLKNYIIKNYPEWRIYATGSEDGGKLICVYVTKTPPPPFESIDTIVLEVDPVWEDIPEVESMNRYKPEPDCHWEFKAIQFMPGVTVPDKWEPFGIHESEIWLKRRVCE